MEGEERTVDEKEEMEEIEEEEEAPLGELKEKGHKIEKTLIDR